MCRFAAVALLLVSGCATPDPAGPSVHYRDLSGFVPDDLAPPSDFARALDLAGRGGDDGSVMTGPDLMLVTTDMATGCSTAQHPVINEVKTGGTTSASDEFIEIYNPCSLTVDLTGWTIVYRSSGGTTDVAIATIAKPIAGNGYNLVASNYYTGAPVPDETYTGGHLAAIGGGLALRNLNMGVVDSVGWGNAINIYVQTSAAPAPAPGQSTARIPNGTNTNNNSADFKIAATPTPKAPN